MQNLPGPSDASSQNCRGNVETSERSGGTRRTKIATLERRNALREVGTADNVGTSSSGTIVEEYGKQFKRNETPRSHSIGASGNDGGADETCFAWICATGHCFFPNCADSNGTPETVNWGVWFWWWRSTKHEMFPISATRCGVRGCQVCARALDCQKSWTNAERVEASVMRNSQRSVGL